MAHPPWVQGKRTAKDICGIAPSFPVRGPAVPVEGQVRVPRPCGRDAKSNGPSPRQHQREPNENANERFTRVPGRTKMNPAAIHRRICERTLCRACDRTIAADITLPQHREEPTLIVKYKDRETESRCLSGEDEDTASAVVKRALRNCPIDSATPRRTATG